jgi:hypothetical protein
MMTFSTAQTAAIQTKLVNALNGVVLSDTEIPNLIVRTQNLALTLLLAKFGSEKREEIVETVEESGDKPEVLLDSVLSSCSQEMVVEAIDQAVEQVVSYYKESGPAETEFGMCTL